MCAQVDSGEADANVYVKGGHVQDAVPVRGGAVDGRAGPEVWEGQRLWKEDKLSL